MFENPIRVPIFLCILLTLNTPLLYSQNAAIDSLQALLKTHGEDTNKVKVLNQLSEAFKRQDTNQAEKYAKLALSLSEVLEYKSGIASAHDNFGIINQDAGNYDLALEHYLKASAIYEETGDRTGIAGCLNNIGLIHYYRSNYNKALEYWEQSLAMERQSDNKKRVATMLNNIGAIHEELKNYDVALEHYNKSLQLRKEENDKAGVAESFQNIAIIYARRDEYKEAIGFFEKALNMREASGDKRQISQTLGNIGSFYNNWAEYQEKKQIPSNEYMAKYQKAEDYNLKSLAIAKQINAKNEIKHAYQNLSEINEKKGNTGKALDYFKKYSSVKDTLYTQESSEKIAEMDAKYQVEKAKRAKDVLEKDKALQDASLKNQRIIIWSAAGGIVLLAMLVFFIYRSNQQKQVINAQLERKNASILQQKQEIEKINTELEKLSIVASETDNSVFIMDAEGNLEWANEGFRRLTGFTLQQFIENRGKNLLEVSGNPQIRELLDQIKENKKAVQYESVNAGRNDQQFWVQTTITPVLGDNGEIKKLVAIDSDITALKEAESNIRTKNEHITASIRYAQQIQQAILPTDEQVRKLLPNSFVLFKPQAIVSGDFYWLAEKGEKVFFTVSDSTGHGVPGAFMSILCTSLLSDAVNQKGIVKPAEIFYDVRKGIITHLKQKEKSEHKDGMDSILCVLDKKKNTIEYSCANNPLYLARGWDLIESEKDKQPVGFLTGEQLPFKNQELKLQKNDTIYLCSDGYSDQLGGPKDKRFMKKQFRELLLSIQPKSMEEQKEILDKTIEEWKGHEEQTDDILIIGVRFA